MDSVLKNNEEELEILIDSMRAKLAQEQKLRDQWREDTLLRNAERGLGLRNMVYQLAVDSASAPTLAKERRTTVLNIVLNEVEQLGFKTRLQQVHISLTDCDAPSAWKWLANNRFDPRFSVRGDILRSLVIQVGKLNRDYELKSGVEKFEISFQEARTVFLALIAEMEAKTVIAPSLPASHPFHGFQTLEVNRQQMEAALSSQFPKQIMYWPEDTIRDQTSALVHLGKELEAAVSRVITERRGIRAELRGAYLLHAESFARYFQESYGFNDSERRSSLAKHEIKALPGKFVSAFRAFEPYVEAIKALVRICQEFAALLKTALDEYKSSSLLPTEAHDKFRYRYSLSESLSQFYRTAVLLRAHEQLDKASSLVPLLVNETEVRRAHMDLTVFVDNMITETLRTQS